MENKPESNFFYVNRHLIHSDRWLSEKFTRGQAWVDLIGIAQHTAGFFRVRGIRVKLERGQLGYSQLTLSKRWKWSRDKVRRYLSELEKDGDIIQQTNRVTTVITVNNYNLWQGGNTTNKQQTDTKQYTYNNDKKEKNEKKETIGHLAMTKTDFNSFWEKYPVGRKVKKDKAQKIFLTIKRIELENILSSLEKHKKSEQWQTLKYIPHPPTWLGNKQWNDEITESKESMHEMSKRYIKDSIAKFGDSTPAQHNAWERFIKDNNMDDEEKAKYYLLFDL